MSLVHITRLCFIYYSILINALTQLESIENVYQIIFRVILLIPIYLKMKTNQEDFL